MVKLRKHSCPEQDQMGCISFILSIAVIFLCLDTSAGARVYTFCGEDGLSYYTNVPGADRTKIRFRLTKEAPAQKKTFRSGDTVGADDSFYAPIIANTAEQFSVEPNLIRAVIKAESNFNCRAVSPKGAQGLMQIMPLTARELGVADPFDPIGNITAGVRYLRSLLDIFDGNYALALAAYNAGPSRVLNAGGIPAISETQLYVRRVLDYLRQLK
jgi:soluble lytic murein transglycosylase-like protein